MHCKSRTLLFCLATCLFLSNAAGLKAQVMTAELVGTVTDPSGAVLPGAQVTVRNLGTNVSRSMTTSGAGTYTFSLLPIGTYSLTIELTGFKTFAVSGIVLATGDRTRVDAKMEIGSRTDTVEVTAEGVGVLQTDSAAVGGLVTEKAVQDLPVNGRNFVKLVQLAPGLNESIQSSTASGTRPDDRRQTSAISANGINDSSNNFQLDGMDNNARAIGTIIVKPSIDALQEVKVQTNMYGAEVGRTGGAVVNMITKSGTNALHGSVFEFLRNDIFDAKDFFNVPQPGNPLAGVKPAYRQNQFGGSIGGPIFKDKTFFFADYEGLRIVQGQTRSVKIPTACELGREACNGVTQFGNFSDYPLALKDPVTGAALPNNIMPASLVDPVGKNFASLYPTMTKAACPDATNCNFVSSPARTQSANTGDLRFDHHFNQRNTFFARYSINDTQTLIPGWLPNANVAGISGISSSGSGPAGQNFASTAYQRMQSGALSFTHIFRPNLMMQLGFQLGRFVTDSQPLNQGRMQDAFGGPANLNSSYPGTEGLATILFNADGYGSVGDYAALPTSYWDTDYQYTGNLVWSKGTHNFKFGGNMIDRNWSVSQILFKGVFVLTGARSGNAMVNLMAGTYYAVMRDISLVSPQYRSNEYGGYFQDDWRATKWLTLNLGVRYDVYTPLKEKHNKISNFDITKADVRAGGQMWVAGQNGISDTVNINTQYDNIQPRLGVAATVAKGMVLRGGFGISYHPTNMMSPAGLKNAPFTTAGTIANLAMFGVPVPMRRISDPLPAIQPGPTCLSAQCGAPAGSSFTIAQATDQEYKYTRIYMQNVTLEMEIAGNVFSVGYLGLAGRNMLRILGNANLPLPPNGPGGCGKYPVPASCQPYNAELPYVSRVQLLKSDGVLNSHAFQTVFQRRYRSGLIMSANYTFGRALADNGDPGGACTTCAIVLNDPHYDYGNSDFDVRHRFVASANYELPFGKSSKGVQRGLIGGWEVTGIYVYSIGTPFTVVNSEGLQGTGAYQVAAGDRPNMLAQGSFTKSLDRWFDITAFRRQPVGTAGNEPRNYFYMPAYTRVDFSVLKAFPISERVKLQFRAEFFNLFNTPSFGRPGNTISGWTGPINTPDATPTNAGGFGKIVSMNVNYTPRDIQFALKLIF